VSAFTRSQGADDLFQFPVKQRVVFLPADEVGGDAAGDFRLLAAPVARAEQDAVQFLTNLDATAIATTGTRGVRSANANFKLYLRRRKRRVESNKVKYLPHGAKTNLKT
jgi:hypothetical protein